MTKISEYPSLSNPQEDDILIGTDKHDSNETKNFSIGSIVNLVENGGRPYKVWTALITQEGENAPVATILENNIGDVVITYVSTGVYLFTLNGAFTLNKTLLTRLSGGENVNGNNSIFENLTVDSFNIVLSDNDYAVNIPIEIRVYN